jgi:hypothetical protein
MTRFATAFLILAIGAAQTVALTDCCCGDLCERPNEVCSHPQPEPKPDCCAQPPEPDSDAEACLHLNPSTQLESHSAALPATAGGFSIDVEPPSTAAAEPVILAARAASDDARGRPPLFLLNLTLRL